MDKELNALLQDESEDAILARIQEESLRYFNEVELPRRVAEQKEEEKKKRSDQSKQVDLEPQPHCSKKIDCSDTTSSTPVKEVFFKAPGQGADGFHLSAGETYVYPTNYPVREYQKNIIHSALFHNTLVSLPTGLGKTFIAAVVMYNYYRWFPQGKIVFMAPTRPLVAQQIRACHDIMAIPIKDTIEMTGAMSPTDRLQHWRTKRVFFLTPQVMANDLRTKACPPSSGIAFKCVVIDEAHRATKEYSYCHVIKELEASGAIFRVLALSATPGSNIKAVVEVVQNLRISTLELRGEDSPDVVPYTHAKQVEPVSLTLSKNIIEFREQYLLIFERYAKSLRESRLITCNVQNLTKFQLLKASEKIRSRPPNGMNKARVGAIMSDFNVCMTLAHGLELLQTYGLRAFHQYFIGCEEEENRKAAFTRLNSDTDFHSLMDKLHQAVSSPMDHFWSHPKHEHLVKILKDHFCQAEKQGTDTKVIIFCQYRVVVSELFELLQKTHPLIKPVMFIGQGAGKDKSGLPQKKQIEVMKGFRQGRSNVLIATCVAEEGLDIGAVDLLIMMECQRSPVRLVQRLGRTGRHRQGRCVVLLTCGREVQKFNEAMATRKSFISMIQNSNVLKSNLTKDEPQMVPPHIMPKIQLVHINIPERITPAKNKKQADIRQALIAKMNDAEEKIPQESPFLDLEQLAEVEKELGTRELNYDSINFSKPKYLFHRMNGGSMPPEELFSPAFTHQSEYNDWNRVLHQTYLVLHSSDTETLCQLLHKSESMMLSTHTDLNTQQVNCSGLFPQKKETRKNKVKTDNAVKKKKIEKEERQGRDIRECMAEAADKVRLTQNKPVECLDNITNAVEESLQTFPEPVVLEISDTGPEKTIKDLKNTSNEKSKESHCQFCDKPFRLVGSQMLRNKALSNELLHVDLKMLRNVETLVENLSKESLNKVNISKMFDPSLKMVNNIQNSVLRLRNRISFSKSKKITSPLISVDEIFDNDDNCSPVLDLNPVYAKERHEEITHHQLVNHNKDYFNLEDIFNEADDDLGFQSLVNSTKTSTPVKGANCVMSNITEKNSIPILPTENCAAQKDVSSFKDKLKLKTSQYISPISKLDKNRVKPVFKIPQMKLNLTGFSSQKTLDDSAKVNTPQTPSSPILSGQVTSHHNTNSSPVLSGLVPLTHGLSPVLSGQVGPSQNNNLSPFLTGQVTSTPKLERKVLFEDISSKDTIETSTFCKPLGPEAKQSNTDIEEIEALNLLSASQLFYDSSEEEDKNKKENLEQSSMYTISQMVAKVSALADKNKVPKTVVSNISTKPTVKQTDLSIHFECSDDSIFEQINLDSFACQKDDARTTKEKSFYQSNLNDGFKTYLDIAKPSNNLEIPSEIEENEVKKINKLKKCYEPNSIHPDNNSNLLMSEPSHKNEESFISSQWQTCMKTPLKTKKSVSFASEKTDSSPKNEESFISSQWHTYMKAPFKNNKSVSFAFEQANISNYSDSESDVFESPTNKPKSKITAFKNGQKNKRRKAAKQGLPGVRGQFLELEADVSVTGGAPCSSDEENTSGLDELDESFINDLTELPSTSVDQTSVDIQAKYLQSVKSPFKMPGFKIPKITDSILERDVFSQAVPEDENDSYENDSFCCDATEIPVEDEPSELEIAERLLKLKSRKEKKRKRKQQKSESSSEEISQSEVLKKNRLLSSSSSNEDLTSGEKRTGKRKHLSSCDSSPTAVQSKKTLKKRRRIQLLTSSDSDSDKTVL